MAPFMQYYECYDVAYIKDNIARLIEEYNMDSVGCGYEPTSSSYIMGLLEEDDVVFNGLNGDIEDSSKTDDGTEECNVCYERSNNRIKCVVGCSFVVCLECYSKIKNCCPQCKSNYTSRKTFYPDGMLRSEVKNEQIKIYYQNGVLKFEGVEGEGKLYNNVGVLLYSGLFSNGDRCGRGKTYYSDGGGVEYEGNFSDNLPHGEGAHYTVDGELDFEGNFNAGAWELD